jgi:hypothetical protein
MAFFDFLDNSLFKPIGKGLAETDTFMKREMPFDSGWGAPAAAVGAYFAAPYLASAMGGSGGFGLGQGTNYANFANTTGGSFGALNPTSAGAGLNAASPSGIAASNSAMGLSNLNPTGGLGGTELLSKLLESQQKTSKQNAQMYGNESPMSVTRQPAFLASSAPVNVQDKQTDLAALIKALRG